MRKSRKKAQYRGRLTEYIAAFYLRCKAYRILAQNWRTPYGEIDIIARKGKTIVFIEVKFRTNAMATSYAIQDRQWRRIAKSAEAYIGAHPHLQVLKWRYDRILISPWRWPQHDKNVWRI